ncbi:MAG: PAS domain S-box protein [Oscillatoriales cyanobacterium C42_A2020_001]|nr:PAS domain S-box protein [Leptolyngbyaceae cyanobacterium C42_A2020_001]
MNIDDVSVHEEIVQLRAQVAALEELLEVYEQETLEKSNRLEKALQELAYSDDALRVLKSILASMGSGVVVVDEIGKFLFINPAATEVLGFQADHILLHDWTIAQDFYLPGATVPLAIEEFPLMRAMNGETVDTTELYVHLPKQGDGIWLSITARSLRDDEGNLRGAVAVFHNITHIKHTEAALRQSEAQSREQAAKLEQAFNELRQTQAQLVQTEKMSSLGQLVAGVAHEINNPVNFIYGNIKPAQYYIADLLNLLQLYQQVYPNPAPIIQAEIANIDLEFLKQDLPNLLRSLQMGADRIRQIVLSLRNFSRLDEAEKKPVDIHEGLENTLLILRNRLKSKTNGPEIQVVKHYGNLPLIECYAGQLNQVFMNIVSNAIEALEEAAGAVCELPEQNSFAEANSQPTIWIRTEQSADDRAVIRIRNNGPAISPEVVARLFDPFFTTKPVGQGTGLGLYISYQIITDKHGGLLKCLSQPGQGVEFWIEIPIHPPSSSSNKSHQPLVKTSAIGE